MPSVEEVAELLFTVDQPKAKWAEYNKPGWIVYERYMRMARAVFELIHSPLYCDD